MRKVHRISDVSIVDFPFFVESNGSLLVMEGGDVVPFEIARVFLVKADAGAIRGNHAHYECLQLLQCNNGSVSVRCDDGDKSVDFSLDEPNQGLLIPPGIWASQTYNDSNSILVVLCDQPFSETDYMRDYDEYLRYRKNLI
jgi:dTDP-4-dehydrorhamnose 3,5-epimerase-like enzyme|tara:strand:+ start:43 stop:465 length:423 start_codon:yes stop_codon:yes gene_type:complete